MGQHKHNPTANYFSNPPEIDWTSVPRQRCPVCHSRYFVSLTELAILSAIQSPTGHESLNPLPVLLCANCKQSIIADDIEQFNSLLRKERDNGKDNRAHESISAEPLPSDTLDESEIKLPPKEDTGE